MAKPQAQWEGTEEICFVCIFLWRGEPAPLPGAQGPEEQWLTYSSSPPVAGWQSPPANLSWTSKKLTAHARALSFTQVGGGRVMGLQGQSWGRSSSLAMLQIPG